MKPQELLIFESPGKGSPDWFVVGSAIEHGLPLEENQKAIPIATVVHSDDLLEALEEAQKHLEYIGYGDAYERDGTEPLKEQIESAIRKARGL